jgi:NitT/TauT family transport system substrate-binding protein
MSGVLAVAALAAVAGCGSGERAGGDGRFIVRVQLDWRPEPQHGGFYQALAKGYFAEEGLDVRITPGGPARSVTSVVASGEADIGQSASTHVMQTIANGMPITNVASLFHQLPTALLMRPENPVRTWEDLDGRTVIARPEAVYLKYLRHHYGIEMDVRKQTQGLGDFLADPDTIQEGFFIAEPYFIREQGVEVRWLALMESGYNPYTILFANNAFLEEHPERAKAFLRAYVRGWKDYLEGDPEPGNKLIRELNPEADPGFMTFARQQIIDHALARGDPAKGEGYGTVDPGRIEAEISMLEELGVLEEGQVSLERALALEFVPEASPPGE